MADKLTDPNKPAHEIIEVLEDGDAIRNDGVRLTAANKNAWYVLATIYGEQEGASFDKELAARNRRAWNGWFCGELSKEKRADRAEKTGLDVADLMPLGEDELAGIVKKFRDRLNNPTAELPPTIKKIYFAQTFFPRFVDFERFVFENDCVFASATFSEGADFASAVFCGNVFFSDAIFSGSATSISGKANFISATFSDLAVFNYAVFSNVASFTSATFNGGALFNSTTFSGGAGFNSVIFNCSVSFGNTTFSDGTYFKSATFSDESHFMYATFSGNVYFNSANFNGSTSFYCAKFLTHAPTFYEAKLYDDTVFPTPDSYTDNWPKLKGDGTMPTADQKRAYNRLRLFMNRSLQIDEEQFFHRQEMRCKTVLASWYHKPFYWLYALLSDYGNSVWRPLFWMVFVMLSGALFMLWWQEAFTFLPKEASGFDWTLGLLGEDDLCGKLLEATGWSISNTLPFLGFGKLYYGGEFAANLAWPLKVVGGVQTVAGFILLFFFGLGLRNRFRLR